MKKYLFLITFSLFFAGCERDLTETDVPDLNFDMNDPSVLEKGSITEGIYMGYFVLRGQEYWCEIEFESNKYEEWPSGGAYFQKEMGCLTKGGYSISNDTLKYDLDYYKFLGFPGPCNNSMKLPGNYRIHLINLNDSLVFSRGVGEGKIKYHLKRVVI